MPEAEVRAVQSMKTIDKAMTLLGLFSTETPEFRLSDIARAADMDKVTAMRILNSLTIGGLVEQNPESKRYRLGTAVLRLARIRENSFPIVAVLQPIIDQLAKVAGESAHSALMSDAGLTTIAICEPNRATRVWVDPAQVLPFHATASGIVFLAFMSPDRREAILKRIGDRRFTDETLSLESLRKRIDETRLQGIARSAGSLETDVTGIAAPVLDWHGNIAATVAVACVRSRLTAELQASIEEEVRKASREATKGLGGSRSAIPASWPGAR